MVKLTEKQFFKQKQKLYAEYKEALKPHLTVFQEAYRPLYADFQAKAKILQDIYEKERNKCAKTLNIKLKALREKQGNG